ncbi:PhzF family phenazine biosynthesis protein [Burkholderia sp. S171]|uniref:PhzF family phenazine biosynthesis protein n=1 Tax=Burkholderia sp. S171 TaxID=1641860 RepID=UPI00131BDEDF|nr:PhzF family phenazine biosynthesis protein [Burkholderia sp. S171]
MNNNAQLYLVDVFTQDSFRGNPVAIIIPSVEPSPKRMLQIAQWLGLPETVFILPRGVEAKAEADYAVRIWSTIRELPFAGHPSIGVAHVLLSKGIISARNGKFIQRSPAGLVQMRVEVVEDQHRIFFQTPIPDVRSVNRVEGAAVIAALRHPSGTDQIFIVDAGARWLVVELPAASDVDRLRPDFDAINSLSDVHQVSGITVLGSTGLSDVHYEVRSFAPAIGVPEDAVCGGGNACAAALVAYRNDWRVGSATHVAGQGKQVHRSGRVFWEGPDADKRIEIGGFAVTVSEGYCLCC